ncbi:hypothetical protein BP5796_02310 [Coleophoma crateriformis]|uniref:Uncharacterized protein n=1 Tax=Coleophoma crateriformis TaxID=565419 RepID=A0A3D8SXV7_9HELO|nr:hypothetical protein BP5796_02310 [Coleophoma crateriformis]
MAGLSTAKGHLGRVGGEILGRPRGSSVALAAVGLTGSVSEFPPQIGYGENDDATADAPYDRGTKGGCNDDLQGTGGIAERSSLYVICLGRCLSRDHMMILESWILRPLAALPPTMARGYACSNELETPAHICHRPAGRARAAGTECTGRPEGTREGWGAHILLRYGILGKGYVLFPEGFAAGMIQVGKVEEEWPQASQPHLTPEPSTDQPLNAVIDIRSIFRHLRSYRVTSHTNVTHPDADHRVVGDLGTGYLGRRDLDHLPTRGAEVVPCREDRVRIAAKVGPCFGSPGTEDRRGGTASGEQGELGKDRSVATMLSNPVRHASPRARGLGLTKGEGLAVVVFVHISTPYPIDALARAPAGSHGAPGAIPNAVLISVKSRSRVVRKKAGSAVHP